MLKEIGKTAGQFLMAHKAQIMIGAGIAGNAAATIIACVKTTKAKDILGKDTVKARDVLNGDRDAKIDKMSDIFPQSPQQSNDLLS